MLMVIGSKYPPVPVSNPDPVTVTVVPPEVGPCVGEMFVIVGAARAVSGKSVINKIIPRLVPSLEKAFFTGRFIKLVLVFAYIIQFFSYFGYFFCPL